MSQQLRRYIESFTPVSGSALIFNGQDGGGNVYRYVTTIQTQSARAKNTIIQLAGGAFWDTLPDSDTAPADIQPITFEVLIRHTTANDAMANLLGMEGAVGKKGTLISKKIIELPAIVDEFSCMARLIEVADISRHQTLPSRILKVRLTFQPEEDWSLVI